MSPFVHGALFWGGLGLASIPLVIHLINRRRFRKVEWAAMEFLLEAMRRNRRRIRLEHLLLLLLRTLLVLAIITAVARPHLSRQGLGWLGDLFRLEEKVFLVDDSLSSGYVEGGVSSLARAGDVVLSASERIVAGGARDPVTIVRASYYEVPLLNAVRLDAARLESVRAQIEGNALRPTALRLDLAGALEDLARGGRPERSRAISLLTDLSRRDWVSAEGGALEALEGALARLLGDPTSPTRLLVVDVGARERANVSVSDLALEARNAIAGVPVGVRVRVTNHGRFAVRGLGVRLRTPAGSVPGVELGELAPGATVERSLSHVFRDAGSTWLEAALEGGGDGLEADNRRVLAVGVLEAIEVLLVDGEPSGVPGEGESDYLAAALRPEGELASGFTPTVVVESNLPREDLERYGLIVLANVARPPEEFVARLAAYVRHGGALAIFPGDLVDPNVYERLFGTGGATGEPGPNLLPARLDELLGSPERPLHPIPDYQHPAFALLAGAGEGLFRLVDVVRFRALEPVPSARVGARLGDNPGSPLLVEREVGAGRVALFAVPADAEWTSWPQNPSYLPAMLELASSLARRQGATSNGIAGAPIFVAIDLARHQREALLRTPSYPRSAERRLIAAPEAPAPEEPAPAAAAEAEPRTDQDTNVNAGTDTDTDTDTGTGTGTGTGFRFTVSDTRESGVYELAMRSVAGATEVRHLAVNAAVEESDLTRIAPEEIERLYPGVRVVRDLDTAETSERARFEVADGLLAAFLVLLLLESLLALRVARHARNVSDARAGAGLVGGTAVRDREYTGGPRR